MPKVSVIIPTYNNADLIGKAVVSVLTQTYRDFEIIVVDNASTDRTGEIAQSYSGVRVVREDRKGLPSARQAGLDASVGDIVAYIDADTRMPEGWADMALHTSLTTTCHPGQR